MIGTITIQQALEKAEDVNVVITAPDGSELELPTESTVQDALDEYNDSIDPLSSTGQDEVTLDIGPRSTLEVYYNVSDGDTVVIETANRDGEFRPLDTIDTGESGVSSEDNTQIPWVARSRVKVTVEGTGGELDIAAGR